MRGVRILQGVSIHTHNNQAACCYRFTGLPGAGKSAIANPAARNLRALGYRVSALDGDELRTGLNRGVGFSKADRAENVRRIGEVAKLMVEAGLIVLVSAIAPYRADREAARRRINCQRYFEVFINTHLQTCIARDTKGLYVRAKKGEIKGLTGWDDPYEVPKAPEIRIRTLQTTAEAAALQIEKHYFWLNDGH